MSSSQSTSSLQSSTRHDKNILQSRKTTMSILAILIATTLNLLGFTMTSPLNPTIGQHFNLPPGGSTSLGSLTSAYPMGMLFGLLLWPKLSDNKYIGRKNIMIISLLGSSIGLLLQSIIIASTSTSSMSLSTTVPSSLWMKIISSSSNNLLSLFLLSRVITGFFSGCGPVTKAYLADLGDKSGKLSIYLGWRDAASTLAYILGPGVGGILFDVLRSSCRNGSGSATTAATTVLMDAATSRQNALGSIIRISALGSFIASLLILTFVRDEPMKSSKQKKSKSKESMDNNHSDINNTSDSKMNDNNETDKQQNKEELQHYDYEIIACPLGTKLWTGVASVCIISFLYHIADSTFFAFFPALLSTQLHLNPSQIGFIFTCLSCVTFCFSASSISNKLIQRIGVVRTCSLGLGSIAIGLGLLSLSSMVSMLGLSSMILTYASAALYFCGVPLYGPTIPTMLLQCVPPHQRGTVMGIDGVINTIGRIISPLVMGDVYRRLGASVTFGLASAAVFSSSCIALIRRWIVLRSQR